MSYSQIFRRLNRVIKSKVNDVLDQLTKDERDLYDFDEQLRNAKGGASREQRGAGEASGEGQGARGSSGGANSGARGAGSSGGGTGGGQRGGAHTEGKRKPGERDDAYYYSVLGLAPDAEVEHIRKTYRKLMALYHPDRVATLSAAKQAEAVEKAKRINEAYQIIARRRGIR